MITSCPDCRQAMSTKDVRVHQGKPRCASGKLTFDLYARGLRPYPVGHSMPDFLHGIPAMTRGAYEGDPREVQPLMTEPTPQIWFPWWADIVNELWLGAVDTRGQVEREARNACMLRIHTQWDERQKMMICRAFVREGLRGAREFIARAIIGDKPELIEEFEARVARLAKP